MSGFNNDELQSTTQSVSKRRVVQFNLPNLITITRLAGSVVLVFVALSNNSVAFMWLFAVLWVTDWLDGRLAVLFKQQTTLGARLDSVADASMYLALLFGACWLKWDLLQQEALWFLAVLISYALTCSAGLIKYGRVPSYHTLGAKACGFLVGISAILVFADWSVWPLRITALGVILINLEAVGITLLLSEWSANVPSIYHAIRLRNAAVQVSQESADEP